MFEVTDAKREMLIGALGYIGASGAGKTLSMLKTAKGFIDKKHPEATEAEKWQKVGVIDTEHKRSKIYAETTRFGLEIGSFKHLNFEKPFTVDRLDQAIKFLKDKYHIEILIIDSVSHFWEGEGGILDLQQQFGGNFQAWRDTNPHYEHFISLVTGDKYGIDTLNGIRAKQHYEVSQNEVGKLKVEKMGLKPVQRDSLEYEFHIVFNIDMDHFATTMKDNSGMFDKPQIIEKEVGEQLYTWLKTGADVFAEKQAQEAAELAEKEAMIDTVKSYVDSPVAGMADYVADLITKAEKRFGDLMKLPLERLQGFVNIVVAKEVELKKEHEALGAEVASELKEHEENTELEKMIVKDLQEVAKTFNITGYSSMKKDELIEAIKKAQAA